MKTVFIEVPANKKSIAMRKLVFGVGINDAEYQVSHTVNGNRVSCPYYLKWKGMMERCYSSKFKGSHKSYENCITGSEWNIFSNFKSWMSTQDWKGKHLDKDILIDGNKTYSASTCAFIDMTTNNFITSISHSKPNGMTGAHRCESRNKYMASCSNPFTKKRENLGYFDSELEAHEAWMGRKHELSVLLANQQNDSRVKSALLIKFLQD